MRNFVTEFTVTEIVEEAHGPLYEFLGKTKEWAEKRPHWVFSDITKQTLIEDAIENGVRCRRIRTEVFFENETPYSVGDSGIRMEHYICPVNSGGRIILRGYKDDIHG